MFEPADNIDLLAVVQEWEEYYEMRFARKPKLVRAHVETKAGLASVPAPPKAAEWRRGRSSGQPEPCSTAERSLPP
jgi:hypothetical protein